jgi:uncharacterized protein (TIGR02118 family)
LQASREALDPDLVRGGLVVSEVLARTRGDLVADAFVEIWIPAASTDEGEAAHGGTWARVREGFTDLGIEEVWLTREHVLRRPKYDAPGRLDGGSGQQPGRLKILGTAYRRTDYTSEAFFRYWLDVHGPLSGRAPGLDGYVVSEVLGETGPMHSEAFVEQWYADQSTLDRATASEEVAVAWADVANYASTNGTFWVVREHVGRSPAYPIPGLLER